MSNNKWKTDKDWAPLISVVFQKIIDTLAKEKIQVTGLVDVKDTQTQESSLCNCDQILT